MIKHHIDTVRSWIRIHPDDIVPILDNAASGDIGSKRAVAYEETVDFGNIVNIMLQRVGIPFMLTAQYV